MSETTSEQAGSSSSGQIAESAAGSVWTGPKGAQSIPIVPGLVTALLMFVVHQGLNAWVEVALQARTTPSAKYEQAETTAQSDPANKDEPQ